MKRVIFTLAFIIIYALASMTKSYADGDKLCAKFNNLILQIKNNDTSIYLKQIATDVPTNIAGAFSGFDFYPIKEQYKYYENAQEYYLVKDGMIGYYLIHLSGLELEVFKGYQTTLGMACVLCPEDGNYESKKVEDSKGDFGFDFTYPDGSVISLGVYHFFLNEVDTVASIAVVIAKMK